MKVCILGDPHIGGSANLGYIEATRQINTRLIDQANLIDYTIDYCINNTIRHLVFTGDIFDSRKPNSVETALFSEKMCRAGELGINCHLIVGNHDLSMVHNSSTIDFFAELKLPYVHVHSDIESVTITEDNKNINLIFFPFRTRKMLRCRTNEEAISRLQEVLDYETKSMIGPKILVGHLMLEGTNIHPSVMDSALSELVLPLNMFNNLDAVIMGHIHPHQIIRRRPFVAYIGSMERGIFLEGRQKKYLLTIDCQSDLTFNFETLPNRNLYDMNIDQSSASTGEQVVQGVKDYLANFEEPLSDSIVRLQIYVNDNALYGFHEEEVISYLKQLGVFHCVGVFTQIISKRQLRKETITERISPQEAFNEFMDLEENSDIKDRVAELGSRIISRRSE